MIDLVSCMMSDDEDEDMMLVQRRVCPCGEHGPGPTDPSSSTEPTEPTIEPETEIECPKEQIKIEKESAL